MGPLVWGGVVPLGPLGQGLLDPSGIRVVGQLKQGLVSIAPMRSMRSRIQQFLQLGYANPLMVV